jgi:hypothetical protein
VNALAADWSGKSIWLQPGPGDEIYPWIAKAATGEADVCVCLLPFVTDAAWFRDHILRNPRAEIRLPMAQEGSSAGRVLVVFRSALPRT